MDVGKKSAQNFIQFTDQIMTGSYLRR